MGDNTRQLAILESRALYTEMVRHPGKFEGRKPYIPYFWEAILNGASTDTRVDDDGGCVDVVEVLACDVEVWPELTVGQRIGLRETDDGFVVCVACDCLPKGEFI